MSGVLWVRLGNAHAQGRGWAGSEHAAHLACPTAVLVSPHTSHMCTAGDRVVLPLPNRAPTTSTAPQRPVLQEFLDMKDAMESELASLKEELATKVKDYEFRLTWVVVTCLHGLA